MEASAAKSDPKYTCKHCLKKTIMVVHMHEQTCDKNPNKYLNIAKRYGPNHLSGALLNKISSQRSLNEGLIKRPLPTSTPTVLAVIGAQATDALPILSQKDLDLEIARGAKAAEWSTMPILSQEDLDSVFNSSQTE